MLIVEGPDGSGKTTLVRRLQKDLRLPVAPRVVGSDTNPTVDLGRWTEDNVDRGFQQVIFDRHRLISEPIYGPILRDRQTVQFLDPHWMCDLMWRFYAMEPIVVYCLPHIETVWHNVQNPATKNSSVNTIEITEALYAGYVSRATIDFSRGVGRLFDYEVTLYSDLLEWVKNKLGEHHERKFDSASAG